ncbi:hypothetical protein N9L49_05835, partial [Rhodospirillales bacterium]|nr:hypothetical protein [Rhodospirillales bacterium]
QRPPAPEPKAAAPRPAPVEGAQQKGPARPEQATEARIGAPPPIPRAPGEEAPRQAAPQPMTASQPGAGPAVAERLAPPPILPPPPPSDGGSGGGDGPGRPMPLPDTEPPAHEDRALAALKDATDLSNCLLPLLSSLNWRGDRRHIAEALPHFMNSLDVTSF